MEIKEIKINVPDGYDIDIEKSTFEHIVFKKKENKLPRTWEEFCQNYPLKRGETSVDSYCSTVNIDSRVRWEHDDRNYLPSRELAEAMLALCQLIQLRECYNDGWKPDWNEIEYCIYNDGCNIDLKVFCRDHKILAFKTSELRDQFYENFKDLIEVAKPLL